MSNHRKFQFCGAGPLLMAVLMDAWLGFQNSIMIFLKEYIPCSNPTEIWWTVLQVATYAETISHIRMSRKSLHPLHRCGKSRSGNFCCGLQECPSALGPILSCVHTMFQNAWEKRRNWTETLQYGQVRCTFLTFGTKDLYSICVSFTVDCKMSTVTVAPNLWVPGLQKTVPEI